MTTLYEIFQTQGRTGVETAAVEMFGAEAIEKVLVFAIVGQKNEWAKEVVQNLSEEQKSNLSQRAMEMACYATNIEMIENVLSWGYCRAENLETYVLFLLHSDGGSPQALNTLFQALATPQSDLDKALVFACRLEFHAHQQEMIEGICKHTNPLGNEKLALFYAAQSDNPALLAGMMPKLRTIPNAQNDFLALPLKSTVRAHFIKLWNDADQTPPVWEKNRIEEELQSIHVPTSKKRVL